MRITKNCLVHTDSFQINELHYVLSARREKRVCHGGTIHVSQRVLRARTRVRSVYNRVAYGRQERWQTSAVNRGSGHRVWRTYSVNLKLYELESRLTSRNITVVRNYKKRDQNCKTTCCWVKFLR